MPGFIKDPDAILDFTVDWSDKLATGEEISSSSWVVPTGITEGSGAFASTNTTTTATIWLSGGTLGETYNVVNRIVTDSAPARTLDQTLEIKVRGK